MIKLWEKIFDKKIWNEDINNNLYLIELNSYFKEKWFDKSHKIMNELEEENNILMKEYYNKLFTFINILKLEFIKWENSAFSIKLFDFTVEEIRSAIKEKRYEIEEFTRLKWLKFIFSWKWIYCWNWKIISIQITYMTYISIEYLIKDNLFLDKLLKIKQWKNILEIEEVNIFIKKMLTKLN